MKMTVTKVDRVVKSESTEYCCGNMQGAIEAENIRKPMYSAQKPAVLLGNRVVNSCPFCGAKVEVVVIGQ
jgi:hypothetical protein